MNNLIVEYSKKFETEFTKALELIKKYDRIAVFRHRVPDFDALGTQLGFANFLKHNFPEKEIIVLGDDHIKFTPRLYPPMDVIEDSWFEKEFLGIIVDVHDPDRVADERIEKATEVVIFDHHPAKEQHGTIMIDDPTTAAASEIVTAFLVFTGLELTADSAKYLYSALVGDSGRFLYSSTSPFSFSVAQTLISTGIDINNIYNLMYESSIIDLKVQAYILNHYNVSKGGVAYYLLKDRTLRKLGISQLSAKAFVNIFANIQEINVWCSISEDTKDKCWRISIRSKRANISEVARKYQGGGHAQASGARLDSLKDLPKFIADLEKAIQEDK